MSQKVKVLVCALVAALFLLPPVSMTGKQDVSYETEEANDFNEVDIEREIIDEEEKSEDLKDKVSAAGSRAMVLLVSKIFFPDPPIEDGTLINIEAAIKLQGKEDDIAKNVEVDFYADDKYIDRVMIDEILGGNEEYTGDDTIYWKATAGDHKIKVIADPDGSHGGPAEMTAEISVDRIDYSVYLDCPYGMGSTQPDKELVYYINVRNEGKKDATMALSRSNPATGFTTTFAGGATTKEIDVDSGESEWIEFHVSVAAGTSYLAEEISTLKAEIKGHTEYYNEIDIWTTVIHDAPILFLDDDSQRAFNPPGYSVTPNHYGAETDGFVKMALDNTYGSSYYNFFELEQDTGMTVSTQGKSGPPYQYPSGTAEADKYKWNNDQKTLADYDVVVWNTGYTETIVGANPADPSGTGLYSSSSVYGTNNWQDQVELRKYVENGGTIWMQDNRGGNDRIQQSAGQTLPGSFWRELFGIDTLTPGVGAGNPIRGVHGDPIGDGIVANNSYLYFAAGDRADGFVPIEDYGSYGVFEHLVEGRYSCIRFDSQAIMEPRGGSAGTAQTEATGDDVQLINVGSTAQPGDWIIAAGENGVIDTTPSGNDLVTKPFRTVWLDENFPSFGDWRNYWDRGERDPTQEFLTVRTLSWLGVALPLPEVNDVGVQSIDDPAGDLVTPGETMKINLTIANYAKKDNEDINVKVSISGDDGYDADFELSETIDIPVMGTAQVNFTWDIPSDKNVEYTIEAWTELTDDGDSSNDKMITKVTSKEVHDVGIRLLDYYRSRGTWEYYANYYRAMVVDAPLSVRAEVVNYGSSYETFDVEMEIHEPNNDLVIYNAIKEKVTLGPGHKTILWWEWTPDMPAGEITNWHSDPTTHAFNHPYHLKALTKLEDDEKTSNDAKSKRDLVVLLFLDEFEVEKDRLTYVPLTNHQGPAEDGRTWRANTEGISAAGGGTSWTCSDPEVPMSGNEHWKMYGADWHTTLEFVEIDLQGLQAAQHCYIYSGHMAGGDTAYQQRRTKTPGGTWSGWSNFGAGGSSGNYGWYIATGGQDMDNVCGQIVQFRFLFNSDSSSSTVHRGPFWDDIAVSGYMTTYMTDDVGVADIYTDPPLGETNELRNIKAVIKNFGTADQDSEFTVTCNITNTTSGEVEQLSDKKISSLGRSATETLEWDWTPEFLGRYEISVKTWMEDDSNPNNNESSVIAWVQYVYLATDFEEDPNWDKGVLDTDGSGIETAVDEWEYGEPVEELVNGRKGPASAHSGSYCYGIDMDDRYGTFNTETGEFIGYRGDSAYLSKEIDMTTAADAKLTFYHWLEVEDSGDNNNIYDKAYIEISLDHGETWEEIWRNPPAPDAKQETLYKTDGWEQLTIPLDDYAGKSSVTIRWRFESDYSVCYAGWYIDDVTVSGKAPLQRDAGIDSIDAPLPGTYLSPGREVAIKATVKNFGLADLVNCKVILNVVKSLGGEPWEEEKYVGTVLNPIETGKTVQVSFDWVPGAQFEGVEYDITIKTYLEDAGGNYDDGNPDNDLKMIIVEARTENDIAINSLSVYPRIGDRGELRTFTASLSNLGNQRQKFNVTIRVKYGDEDPVIAFIGEEELEPSEVIDNWNATWVPEVYTEYTITITAEDLKAFNFAEKVWEEEHDQHPENNEKTTQIMIPKVLWEDDMESELNEWTLQPLGNEWHIEEIDGYQLGYHGSDASWRFGNGIWTDPYPDRLYPSGANDYLVSPVIDVSTVEASLGISFWTKYYIEPMDSRGKYLDRLKLEYSTGEEWKPIYLNDYDHSPYNAKFWNWELFWPKDNGPDTSNSEEYPGNEHGWINNEITFDAINPLTNDDVYVDGVGGSLNSIFSDIKSGDPTNFQFRFGFYSDSSVEYTGPWIDNVKVYGRTPSDPEPPIAKFDGIWKDVSGIAHEAYSMNKIQASQGYYTILDNILPREAGIPYQDPDHNIVNFISRSAHPYTGTNGLTYEWDFNDLEDTDKNGIFTDDADMTGEIVDWHFSKFGTFTVTLTVIHTDGIATDTMQIVCGDKPIHDVEIKVEDIFETEDSVSAVDNMAKYGSGEEWTVWQGDKIVLSGAGAKDPEGTPQSEFIFRWVYTGTGDDDEWDDLQWIQSLRGEPSTEITFDKPGRYHVILEVDDAYNQDRYESGIKPVNCSADEIAKFSWLDDINVTVLPYARLAKTIFISDMENNVVEVRYDMAYQAGTLTEADDKGEVFVNKTNEPEDSETTNNLKTFIDFKTKNMYNGEGKSGFIWSHIIVIYEKSNLPKQLQLEEANVYNPKDPKSANKHVVLLYYWDKIFNTWVKCSDTMKAKDNDIRDLTAVECNVTHFTTIAPMINVEAYPKFGTDPAIDTMDITFSVDTILGRGGKERDVIVYAKIHNKGLLPIPELDVKFKDGDVVIGDLSGANSVKDIPGLGSKTVSITWKIDPNIDSGLHTIKVELDPTDKIYDLDDSNDIARKKINVVDTSIVTTSYTSSFTTMCVAVIGVVAFSTIARKKGKKR